MMRNFTLRGPRDHTSRSALDNSAVDDTTGVLPVMRLFRPLTYLEFSEFLSVTFHKVQENIGPNTFHIMTSYVKKLLL